MRMNWKSLLSLGAMALASGMTSLAAAQGRGGADDPSATSPKAALEAAKMRFLENAGQWDPRAKFLFQKPNLDYWVTADGVVLDFYRLQQEGTDILRSGHVVRMKFEGASRAARAEGAQQRPGITAFFIGPDPERWAERVRGFGEAIIRSLYAGIDFRNYIDEGRARYDLIVRPGADPGRVRIRFEGVDGVRVDERGDLIIPTSIGDLRQSELFAYQEIGGEKVRVPACFVVTDSNTVRFEIGEYDRTKPLVIDPLVYGSHFGADSFPPFIQSPDAIADIVQDGENNVYLTGDTQSPVFPITDGPYGNFSLQGASDAFLTKLVGDAFEYAYSAYIGGIGADFGRYITLDNAGNVWMAGTTTGNFPVSATALQGVYGGGANDIFLVQFKPDAAKVLAPNYATYFGGPGADNLGGLEVNGVTGQVVLAGDANVNIPLISGTIAGSFDAWVAYLSSNGQAVQFSKYIGGTAQVRCGGPPINTNGGQVARGNGLAIDPNGNVIVVGSVINAGNVDTSTAGGSLVFQTTPNVWTNGRLLRNSDSFIVKLAANGNTLFSGVLGGSIDERGRAVTVDQFGNIYLTGITNSFDYPRTRGVYGELFSASNNVFVTKINSQGNQIIWSTNIRSTGPVFPTSIGVDSRNVVTIGGVVSFTPVPGGNDIPGSIPTTPDALDPNYNGGNEANPPPPPAGFPSTEEGFMLTLNADATQNLYSSYIGESGNDIVTSIYNVFSGSILLVGSTRTVFNGNGEPKSPFGLPPGYLSGNALKRTPDPLGDGFLIKFRVRLPVVTTLVLNPSIVPGGLGAFSTGTVVLSEPAPPGGINVQLKLDNGAAATFVAGSSVTDANLFIDEGQTTGTFQVFTFPVVAPTPVLVRAGIDGNFQQSTLTVSPWLDGLDLIPDTVVGGNPVQGRVRLLAPAPAGGVTVILSTANPSLVLLPSGNQVTVPEGQQSVTFPIGTRGVTTATNVGVTAALLGANRTRTLRILPASLVSISFDPAAVTVGEPTTGTVRLDGEAGANIVINLAVAGAPLVVPPAVTIPAGQRQATFTANAPFLTVDSSSTVTATRAAPFQQVQTVVFIVATDIASVSLSQNNVIGGTLVTGTVLLTKPAGPGGITINLSNSNPAAGSLGSPTVRVPGGSLVSEQFTFQTAFVATTQTTVITASKPGGFTSQSATLTVTPAPLGLSLSFNPNPVPGGTNSIGTLTLDTAAPTNLQFQLSANSGVVQLPTSVTVPQGQSSATFLVQTQQTTQDVDVTITAQRGSQIVSGILTVTAPNVFSLRFTPNTVRGGNSSVGTVILDQPAPPGGLTILLTANNQRFVNFPAQVFVPEGSDRVEFTVTTSRVSRNIAVEFTARVQGRDRRVSGYLFITR